MLSSLKSRPILKIWRVHSPSRATEVVLRKIAVVTICCWVGYIGFCCRSSVPLKPGVLAILWADAHISSDAG